MKDFKTYLIHYFNTWKWYSQGLLYLAKDSYIIHNVKELSLEGRGLVIIPHADDEWIGCSQIIKNHSNCEGFFLNWTGSNQSQNNRQIRESEIHKLCYNYDFKCFFCNSDDDRLAELLKVIESKQFKHFFVPSFIDWHDEHIKACKILREALVLCKQADECTIVSYQVSVPFPISLMNRCHIMNKNSQREKWDTFVGYYPSQKLPTKRFIEQERVSGRLIGEYSVECYSELSFSEWSTYLDKLCNKEIERKELKNLINNIYKIRKYSSNLLVSLRS